MCKPAAAMRTPWVSNLDQTSVLIQKLNEQHDVVFEQARFPEKQSLLEIVKPSFKTRWRIPERESSLPPETWPECNLLG
mgnify:CR=1 FL=1